MPVKLTRNQRAIVVLRDANSALKADRLLLTDEGPFIYRPGTDQFMRIDPHFAIGYAQSAIDQALRILQGQE